MHTTHSRAKSLRTGDWLVGAVEGTQTSVHQMYKKLSTMPPVSRKVKRVNLPTNINERPSDGKSPSISLVNVQEGELEHQADTKGLNELKRIEENISNSTQFQKSHKNRPQSAAVIIEKTRSTAKLDSIPNQDVPVSSPPFRQYRRSSAEDTEDNSIAQKNPRRMSEIPLRRPHLDTDVEPLTRKETLLQRRSYNNKNESNNMSSPSGINNYALPVANSSLYRRRPSQAATQVLVGSGFSNTTTHHDFMTNKTALQSAVLTLAQDLNPQLIIPHNPMVMMAPPIPASRSLPLTTIDEISQGTIRNIEPDLTHEKKNNSKNNNNVSLYHQLSQAGETKEKFFCFGRV